MTAVSPFNLIASQKDEISPPPYPLTEELKRKLSNGTAAYDDFDGQNWGEIWALRKQIPSKGQPNSYKIGSLWWNIMENHPYCAHGSKRTLTGDPPVSVPVPFAIWYRGGPVYLAGTLKSSSIQKDPVTGFVYMWEDRDQVLKFSFIQSRPSDPFRLTIAEIREELDEDVKQATTYTFQEIFQHLQSLRIWRDADYVYYDEGVQIDNGWLKEKVKWIRQNRNMETTTWDTYPPE